jgi:hypothetical protein
MRQARLRGFPTTLLQLPRYQQRRTNVRPSQILSGVLGLVGYLKAIAYPSLVLLALQFKRSLFVLKGEQGFSQFKLTRIGSENWRSCPPYVPQE